jgi:hypothetical protein
MGNREHYLKSFLIAGIVIGALSSSPGINVGNCCGLWQILGGGMAGWILCRSAAQPVRAGEGALVGIFSGLIGGMIFSLMAALTYFWNPNQFSLAFQEALQNQGTEIPPEVQVYVDEFLRWFTHPGLLLVILLFSSLVIFAIIAMSGSMIAVTIFEPRFAVERGKNPAPISYQPAMKMPEKMEPHELTHGEHDLYFPRKDKEEE